MDNTLAFALALSSALCFAVASVLQARVAAQAPARLSLSPALLVYLARRRQWLLGVLVMAVGNVLQAAALGYGSLALVEPMQVSALLFALPLGAAVSRQHLTRQEWVAALAVSGGLAGLMAVGGAAPGQRDATTSDWLLSGVATASAATLLTFAGRRRSAVPRATLYAAAGGMMFGLQDALTKSGFAGLDGGVDHLLATWQPYALLGAALYGLLLVQSAYKTAPLPVSLPPLLICEPLAGTLIGVTTFGERPRVGGLWLVPELVAAAVMVAGAHTLARSPLVTGHSRAAHAALTARAATGRMARRVAAHRHHPPGPPGTAGRER